MFVRPTGVPTTWAACSSCAVMYAPWSRVSTQLAGAAPPPASSSTRPWAGVRSSPQRAPNGDPASPAGSLAASRGSATRNGGTLAISVCRRPLPVPVQGGGDQIEKDIVGDRLGQAGVRALGHGLHLRCRVQRGGDDDRRQAGTHLAETAQQGDPVHLRHSEVGDQEREPAWHVIVKERGGACIGPGGKPGHLEQIAKRLAHGHVVIHNRDNRSSRQWNGPHKDGLLGRPGMSRDPRFRVTTPWSSL